MDYINEQIPDWRSGQRNVQNWPLWSPDLTPLVTWKNIVYWHKVNRREKVKAKAVPLHAVETLGGEEVQLLLNLNLGTRQEWVVSVMHRQRFSSGKRTTGIHWMGGWVSLRTGLDTEVRGKSLLSLPGIELWSPGHPVCSQTLYWLNYLAPVERNYIIKFLIL
jgi:hypothetical protein